MLNIIEQYRLKVIYDCPRCGRQREAMALMLQSERWCECGLCVIVQRHPNGRVTVEYDPAKVTGRVGIKVADWENVVGSDGTGANPVQDLTTELLMKGDHVVDNAKENPDGQDN